MSTTDRCCGSSLQVIPLRAGPDGPVVELLRCRRCSRSHWRSEGADVTRTQALEALGPAAAAPTAAAPTAAPTAVTRPAPVAAPIRQTPRPARSSRAVAASAAPARTAELRELLSGWQVFGT